MLSKVFCAVAALSLFVASAIAQQKYPTRPIEIVVPAGPGGGLDTLSRVIHPLLEKEL